MIKKPAKPLTKDLKAKCIRLSGRIATSDGICCTCYASNKSQQPIFPSHIISRRYALTAARTDNQLPQCSWCARYYTDNPVEWKKFVDKKYPGRRLTLEAVARCGKKMDWQECYEKLEGDAKIAGIL